MGDYPMQLLKSTFRRSRQSLTKQRRPYAGALFNKVDNHSTMHSQQRQHGSMSRPGVDPTIQSHDPHSHAPPQLKHRMGPLSKTTVKPTMKASYTTKGGTNNSEQLYCYNSRAACRLCHTVCQDVFLVISHPRHELLFQYLVRLN
mmetsp:Transcript_72428/g.126675  ORF Transcript_72428/g.126675 Transcript_72428/m.126675 type:complete len:145 (+) Transcript_72428:21-455(+)